MSLVRIKRKRKRIIAKTFTKKEIRTVYIKDRKLLLEIEDLEGKKVTSPFYLKWLIARFNRCDQRKKAIGYEMLKFTDFGFGFMTALDLISEQNPDLTAFLILH